MGRAEVEYFSFSESRGVISWNWEERDNNRIPAMINNSENMSRTSLSSLPTLPVKDRIDNGIYMLTKTGIEE